jgi:hypothetical protein
VILDETGSGEEQSTTMWPMRCARTNFALGRQRVAGPTLQKEQLMNSTQARARRGPSLSLAAAGALLATGLSIANAAEVTLPPVSLGAGIQTGFYSCDKSCLYSPGTPTKAGGTATGFALDSARLYISGSVTDDIKLTFNTEYTSANNVEVMDAFGSFHFSDAFNLWAGRFLPPSDRPNLYGPYYADDWTPYADGVADYYPNVAVGRDNGVAYWGDFGMAKLQVGAFDGQSLNSAVKDPAKVLWAGRFTLDFWDKESGYYFNGTYYGDKDLLALGLAGQTLDSKTTWSLDGLLEKNLAGAGVVTVEADYNKDNGLTGSTPSKGWFGLGAFMFPQVIGIGKFQVLAKYSEKTIDATATVKSFKLKTTEANLNYVIKAFSARVGVYYLTQKVDVAGASTPSEFGLKLQLQM